LDLDSVLAMGHSAGGHLALCPAGQKGGRLRGVVLLAGVADLRRAWEMWLSNGVVEQVSRGFADRAPASGRSAACPPRDARRYRAFEISRSYVDKAGGRRS